MENPKKIFKKTSQSIKTIGTADKNTREKINKITSDLVAKAKELKTSYSNADPETKRNIIAGLTALSAGLIALARRKNGNSKLKTKNGESK